MLQPHQALRRQLHQHPPAEDLTYLGPTWAQRVQLLQHLSYCELLQLYSS